jgi:RimJ/RimL family protein N-acetyltransferase
MQYHVEALYTHDDDRQLVAVNEPNGAPAPRFFLGRTIDGPVCRFRHDVAPDLRQELEAAVAKELVRGDGVDSPIDPAHYERIIGRHASVQRTWTGPAFCFPDNLPASGDAIRVTRENAAVLERHLHAWIPDVPLCDPMLVSIVDGDAVAVCGSVRRTNMGYEAGVETAPAYRRQGHATQVVSAWAHAVRDMGLLPLYSTSWRNEASRAVARRLALVHFGSDMHIT